MWFFSWFRKHTEEQPTEPLFSLRRDPRDTSLSFWTNESLYEELRSFAGGRDASRLLRASIVLGLGVFRERPELMLTLDTRGAQKHHVTLWVSEAIAGRVLVVSQNQQSRFIRASAELGLCVFRVHPELISTLDEGRTE